MNKTYSPNIAWNIVSDGASCDLAADPISLLIDAAERNDLTQVKQYVSNDTEANTEALRWAATQGHPEVVAFLLPHADLCLDRSEALFCAASHGHHECVRLLLPFSDAKALESRALVAAASEGHHECVRLLLPMSDPTALSSWALQAAARHNHQECIDLLWDVSDPKEALLALQHGYPHTSEVWMPLLQRMTEQQRSVLQQAVDADLSPNISTPTPLPRAKI